MVMSQSILPRVHGLALKSTVAAVRVNALLCLAELVQTLDKHTVTEILQTIQRCTAVDRSAPTLICVLLYSDANKYVLVRDGVGLKDKKSLVVTARFVFGALGCVMLGALIYTCLTDCSPFCMELLYPWMVVLLVNFYINVAVLSVWVVNKESSWIIGILWVAVLLRLFLV